jgi:hypothetical protein
LFDGGGVASLEGRRAEGVGGTDGGDVVGEGDEGGRSQPVVELGARDADLEIAEDRLPELFGVHLDVARLHRPFAHRRSRLCVYGHKFSAS